MPFLALHDVTFAWPRAASDWVLRVPALAVERGERVAFVGPSGCGKTTLLSLVSGELAPCTGTVRIDGVDLATLSERGRRVLRARRIGSVFQDFALIEHLSVLENVLLPFRVGTGMRCDADARARAAGLADTLGIGHLRARKPARLSHGERQRVAIARALVVQPDLLLCDEPTASLDPARADAALDLLVDQAAAHGAALLLVTHDPRAAARMDRTIDLAATEVVA